MRNLSRSPALPRTSVIAFIILLHHKLAAR
jgi:hypothetical protein